MNVDLLSKWLWRLGGGSAGLLKQNLVSEYDISRDGWVVLIAMPHSSSLWKGILSVREIFFSAILDSELEMEIKKKFSGSTAIW